MALDIDRLLVSFGADAPSGEDLEYDPDFINLEIAAMPKDEQQVDDKVRPGEEPDFKTVKDAAVTVLKRAHDLRAAVFYAHAALRTEGIGGFEQALAYMKRCCEEFWESCHPQLDEDDGDPTARMNALAGLADNDTVLRALRMAPLTQSRGFGRFGLRDIQIARGEVPPAKGEETPDPAAIAAAFQDTPVADMKAYHAAIVSCRGTLKELEALLASKVGPQAPDLDRLAKTLYDIEQAFTQYAGSLLAEEEEDAAEAEGEAEGAPLGNGADPDAPGPSAPASGAAPRGVGTIASRKDVMTALDRIIEYYAKHEPTSPVPMLLERAKRLVTADFVTILRDLAPEGLDKFRMIAGTEDE